MILTIRTVIGTCNNDTLLVLLFIQILPAALFLLLSREAYSRDETYSGDGCLCVGPIANLKGHYFQPSLSVCVCL